jgi:DNA-binding LacI/PurR family transcriptional regulator
MIIWAEILKDILTTIDSPFRRVLRSAFHQYISNTNHLPERVTRRLPPFVVPL